MDSAERSIVFELVHELDNMRQIVKLDREKERIRGGSDLLLRAYDEALNRSGKTADKGRRLVDQAWVEQIAERKMSAAGV
jgi:hypothetical protein